MSISPRVGALLLGVAAALLLALAVPAQGAPDLATRLPIVVIDADGPIVDDPKVGARMRVIHNRRGALNRPTHRPTVYDGRIGIEVRGQSSQRFPKKQFGFETIDRAGENRNVSLLGLPAENDWILYAAYNDGSLLRNVVAYRAARQTGRYASRTRVVEVVLNGRYWGVYVLMEKLKLDDNRVSEPPDSDGFLLEYTHPSKIDPGDTWFRTPITRTPILYDDPERGDMPPARAAQIARQVGAFERALYGREFRHPTRGWRAHLDAASAVDYVLLYELFRNHDAFSASTFLHQGADGRLALGPLWDFDLSMGNPADVLPPRGCSLCDRRWAQRLYKDGEFVRAMTRRWTHLRRQGFVRTTLAAVERDARALQTAQVRNLRRWPVLGFTPVAPDASGASLRAAYRAETTRLTRWIRTRAGWLTASLPRIARLQ